MNTDIRNYIEKYDDAIQKLFLELQDVVISSTGVPVEEKLWAGLPSYYVEKRFVRLIPFKSHINVEAAGLARYAADLAAFTFTPKGMLKLKPGDKIPSDILQSAFKETFLE